MRRGAKAGTSRRATCAAALWLVAAALSQAAAGESLVTATLRASVPCEDGERLDDWPSGDDGGLSIGRIHYGIGDIFDPSVESEDRAVFRLVNRLHPTTRRWVVEEQLLFASGERLERRVVEETERRLRSLGYLYDAVVVPVCRRGDAVDLLVATRDVWTLGIKASFRREGGVNSWQAGLSDDNFLGTGRPVSLLYISDPDRDAYQLRYYDPSLFGPNREARFKIEQRSDGHRHTLDAGQPFYSLDTRRALTARLVTDQRTQRLWDAGEEIQWFDHRNRLVEGRFGLSGGYREGRVRRLSFGYTWQEDRFALLEDSPGPDLPEDRELSYPWIEIAWVEDGYVEASDLDRIGRTEDLNLGASAGVRVGQSLEALGGDRNRTILSSWLLDGWRPGPGQLLLFASGLDGRFGTGGEENLLARLGLEYYWRNFGRQQLYAALRLEAGWNLDGERQLLLGGDTGLRGYERNIQTGDRRMVLTLEQRFYSRRELLDLVNVGAALFFDAGAAWYDSIGSPEVLTNVGFGLRLGSSRSAQGGMVHLDVAYPLDGDTDGIQFLVRSRETF